MENERERRVVKSSDISVLPENDILRNFSAYDDFENLYNSLQPYIARKRENVFSAFDALKQQVPVLDEEIQKLETAITYAVQNIYSHLRKIDPNGVLLAYYMDISANVPVGDDVSEDMILDSIPAAIIQEFDSNHIEVLRALENNYIKFQKDIINARKNKRVLCDEQIEKLKGLEKLSTDENEQIKFEQQEQEKLSKYIDSIFRIFLEIEELEKEYEKSKLDLLEKKSGITLHDVKKIHDRLERLYAFYGGRDRIQLLRTKHAYVRYYLSELEEVNELSSNVEAIANDFDITKVQELQIKIDEMNEVVEESIDTAIENGAFVVHVENLGDKVKVWFEYENRRTKPIEIDADKFDEKMIEELRNAAILSIESKKLDGKKVTIDVDGKEKSSTFADMTADLYKEVNEKRKSVEGPAQEQVAPAQEAPTQEQAAPAEEAPAQEQAAPAEEKPTQEQAAPVEEKPAQEQAAPAQGTPAAPTSEQPQGTDRKPEQENDRVNHEIIEHIYRVNGARRAKVFKFVSAATIAAAGFGIFGAPIAIPAILGGLAAGAAGLSAVNDMYMKVKRAFVEHKLKKLAKSIDCELVYDYEKRTASFQYKDADGKVAIVESQDIPVIESNYGINLQEKLDKYFKNSHRGNSTPTTGRDYNYKDFSKVTVDNLEAAFEPYMGVLTPDEAIGIQFKPLGHLENVIKRRRELSAASEANEQEIAVALGDEPEQQAPVQEQAAPAAEAPAQEQAAPAAEAPAQEQAAPAAEAPAQEEAAPAEEAPAQEEAAPAEEAPAQEQAVPAEEAPAQEQAAPVGDEISDEIIQQADIVPSDALRALELQNVQTASVDNSINLEWEEIDKGMGL